MTKPSLHEVDKKVSVLTEIVERIETNHLEHIKNCLLYTSDAADE